MSFGKDDSHLGTIGGYGAGTFGQQATAASVRSRSRGKMPYWKDTFDVSENPTTPDVWRVIKGEYKQQLANEAGQLYEATLPFYEWREHFHGSTSKGAICSAGPLYLDRDKRALCEGCEMYWSDYSERKAKKARGDNTRGPNRISMTDKFSFTVFDYGIYFQMPQVDQSGQFRMNPKTNQPYTEWVKAYNPQDPQFAGRPWKQGDLRPWAVGKTWKDTLVNYSLTIGLCCKSCGAQNSIYSRGWYCGNPQCRQLIFDPSNTTMPADRQLEIQRNPYSCPHCQQTLFPHEEVGCHSCQSGARAAIFDVDLVGYRQRSGDGNQTNLVITGFRGPGPIAVQDQEVLAKIKPIDLPRRYAPTAVDIQRKLWNITGPAAQQGAPPPPPAQHWAPPPGAPQMSGQMPPPQQYAPQPQMPPVGPQGYAVTPAGHQVYQGPPPMVQPAMPPQQGFYQPPQQPQPVTGGDISAQLAALGQQGNK